MYRDSNIFDPFNLSNDGMLKDYDPLLRLITETDYTWDWEFPNIPSFLDDTWRLKQPEVISTKSEVKWLKEEVNQISYESLVSKRASALVPILI